MAMLQVECRDCGDTNVLRGGIEKEDLIGTKYEHLMDTITKKELSELEDKGEIQDPWDKFKGIYPSCGSKNVITY